MTASGSLELRSDVKELSAAEWDALVVAHEGSGLWLRPEARSSDLLRPGAITVIKGRGVLKVGAITEEGDHLVVENLPAGFGEIAENGSLHIGGAARFDLPFGEDEDDPIEVRDIEGTGADAPPPPANGEGGTKPASLRVLGDDPLKEQTTSEKPGKQLYSSAKKALTDGWEMSKQVTGDGDALHYDITLTKDSGALVAKLHLVGSVNNLATAFDVAVRNRVTQQQTYDVKTSGEADLTWEVGIREGSVGYDKILLPGLAYRQVFFVGEVPMVLKVKSGFALVVGATGKNTTTTGKVHVTWSNDGGVSVTPSEGASTGAGQGEAAYSDLRGTLAVGPSAFSVVATLPRIELGMGVDGLFVAGSHFSNTMTAYVESRGAIGGSTCANVETKLEGKMGVLLDAGQAGSLLLKGLQLTEDKLSKQLYEKKTTDVTCGLK